LKTGSGIHIRVLKKVDLSGYYTNLRLYITTMGKENPAVGQTTTRKRMPKTLDNMVDKVVIFHPHPSVGNSLPMMTPAWELKILVSLMEDLNNYLKWNLDTAPLLSREANNNTVPSGAPSMPCLLIGNSKTSKTFKALSDMGVSPLLLDDVGHAFTPTTVDALLPRLERILVDLDPAVPVVIYNLDNVCFKKVNEEGELLTITRLAADKKFHVVGELSVTPVSLLKNTIIEVERLIRACGNRRVFVIGALPRYLLKSCCDNPAHCSNVRGDDETALGSSMRIMNDLMNLNFSLERQLTKGRVRFVNPAELLLGKVVVNMDSLMEVLISTWSSSGVHGDKLAYTKIAMSLMTLMKKEAVDPTDPRGMENPRKRRREDNSPITPPRSMRGL